MARLVLRVMQPKLSETDHQPFRRMLVRLKKEIIAFGVEGIDPARRTSPKLSAKELKRRKIELLPANLLDATRNLEKDAVIREALGNTGTEDYVDYYVKTKQEEWKAYHEQVTPWEVNRYLTLF